jgi:hypothetical protein
VKGRFRACDRCGRRLRNPGPDCEWNVIVELGVITGLICPNCQTPAENAEAAIHEATLDYAVIDGRLAGRHKGAV